MNGYDRIKEHIMYMALKHCYWGYLFSLIDKKQDNSLNSVTALKLEDDGKVTMLYNSKLLETAPDKTIDKCIEHDGLHLLNNHISRFLRIVNNEFVKEQKEIKSLLFHISADMAVNQQINMPKLLKINKDLSIKPLFPEDFDLPQSCASEYYFDELLDGTNSLSVGSGKNESQSKSSNNNSKKNKLINNLLNKNKSEKNSETEKMVSSHDKWSDGTEKSPDNESLARKNENYVKTLVKESLKSMSSKDRSNLPSYITESIDQLFRRPLLPYYEIIKKLVIGSRLSKFKLAYSKINKKRVCFFLNNKLPITAPFPGKTKDFSFNIGILIDTSGSQSKEEIHEALMGVKNIIDNDKNCKTTVVECDTSVKKIYEVKKLRDIQFDVKGRGGTTLLPGLQKLKELKPDIVLAFSDGYCDNLNVKKKELPKRIIWVIPKKNGRTDMINRTGFVVRADYT